MNMAAAETHRIKRNRQIALVTGATGTIGRAIAGQLAANPDTTVVLACRDAGKGESVAHAIVRATGNPSVRVEIVNLSRRPSIQQLATRWQGPLHVLINNAAITPRRRLETPEGIELQFATNVLGYFWMIDAFRATLEASAPARIVNVASYWAGDLDLSDLEFRTRRYSNGEAYRQSKQADRMLTAAFAERLKESGISVNACHPGDVNSPLSNNLGFAGHQTPEEAARTPVWLALDPTGQHVSGKFFEGMRAVPCPFAANPKAVEALYVACQAY
jgi:NAD(P)-dependent dehydrogenase (short-subunit alcohol dehydrogenase family)